MQLLLLSLPAVYEHTQPDHRLAPHSQRAGTSRTGTRIPVQFQFPIQPKGKICQANEKAAVSYLLAVEALATRHSEGRYNVIALLEILDAVAHFGNHARELMAHDEPGPGRLVTTEDMELTVALRVSNPKQW